MFSVSKRGLGAWLLLVIALAPVAAFSGEMPMRCGASLAQIGDDENAVRSNCGEPSRIKEGKPTRPMILGHEHTLTPQTKWYYNRGSADFIYILSFEKGKLVDISMGQRGFEIPEE